MGNNGAEEEEEEEDDDEEDDEEEEEEEDDDEDEDEGGRDEVANNGNKAAAGGGGDDFEASLLLNIGAFSPEKDSAASMPNQNRGVAAEGDVVVASANNNNLETDRLLRERGGSGGGGHTNGANDPNTLPTSMSSFLDVLTEEQRRTRHRHIPGVDGFRRLYRGEVKSDMARARRCRNANSWSTTTGVGVPPRKEQRRSSDGDNDDGGLDDDDDVEVRDRAEQGGDVDVEEDGAVDDDDAAGDGVDRNDDHEGIQGDPTTNRARGGAGTAFVAPTREARQRALGGELAFFLDGAQYPDGGSRPPNAVDSITTFHPPRPQESTSTKTRLRLRRWEANPGDVDADLSSYRKTVGRTRAELDVARAERLRIEAVSTLVRGHMATHLESYRVEATAIDEGLGEVIARCVKLADDEVSARGVSTRSSGGKGMRDVLATLMTLGEEVKGSTISGGAAARKSGDAPEDWRAVGVGGVYAKSSGTQNSEGRGGTTIPLSCGWLLVGDEVIVKSTREEGVVVSIDGPKVRTDSFSAVKNMTEMESGADSKALDKNDSSSSGVKEGTDFDAMDLDARPNNNEEQETTAAASPEKHDSTVTVEPVAISVKLTKSGQVHTYAPAEVEFNTEKLPALAQLSHSALAKRWDNMIRTALVNCVDHDVLAMTNYKNALLIGGRKHDDTGVIKNDGTSSPTSVGQYDDERTLLPFGAGLVAAPGELKNYPSVVPLDVLEETVRHVVYGTDSRSVSLVIFFPFLNCICILVDLGLIYIMHSFSIKSIPTMPSALGVYESRQEEINTLKGKVLQLRNRLSRQNRLRGLNEHSLVAGKSRANKAEELLLEMQMDLKNLKGRLQDELTELGKYLARCEEILVVQYSLRS